ncbi:cytochrome-c peroxidase [Kaarinaea lacus]
MPTGIDFQLRTIIEEQGLTGDPTTGRILPRISSALAQLGMKLFFSKALGGNQDSACVTCHHPMLGGGDNLSLPVGVGAIQPDLLGPGRYHAAGEPGYDGGPTVPRNVLSTFNSALYDSGLFWDSRIESLGKTPKAGGNDGLGIRTPDTAFGIADTGKTSLLHAQAGFPVTSREEMRGFTFEVSGTNATLRAHIAARLGNYGVGLGELASPQWEAEFRMVYGYTEAIEQLITFDRIAQAIATYEASQIFVDNAWKDYVEGNESAISLAAKRGALIFFLPVEQGGANCASCHSGDFFTDEKFHLIATPQIGRGKGDGPTADDDFGRYRETQDVKDKYAFRTANLLNLSVSGPYGHAGAYTTLEGIVRHHLDPVLAFNNYDLNQLDPDIQIENIAANTHNALSQLAANRAAGMESLQNVALTDAQVQDLIAFLNTLNDPCVSDRACLAAWIPSPFTDNPDGLRIDAFDKDGNLL